ncbi:MAG: S41 family peptidase [Minisyncoccia bacterium]
MNKKLKEVFKIIGAILVIGLVFLTGFLNGVKWGYQTNLPHIFDKIINREKPADLPPGDMKIFWDTWKIILEKYIYRDKLDTQKMIEGAAKGLVESLNDPFSEFLTADENKTLNEELSGEFFGIGMEIARKNNNIIVVSPLPNTPAEKAGLLPNDIILKINEKDTLEMSTQMAAKLIRGPKGTTVVLTIFRPATNETKEIKVIRDKIIIPSLSWQILDDNIVYLRIYTFNSSLILDFAEAALKIQALKPKGLILDLRNNPGGYLDTAINVAGWFLDRGDIIVKEDFGNGEIKISRSTGPSLLKNISTVILVNEGSASATEILAGALRDNRHIPLIGEKTFGKGSVQELVPLGQDSVKITIAEWLTPNNIIIQKNGLTPDIIVKNKVENGLYSKIDLTNDLQLLKAIETLKEIIKTNK